MTSRHLRLLMVWSRFLDRPHQAALALAWVVIGVAAVVLGVHVSFSVTRVFGFENPVIRVWGAYAAFGGALMSYGILAGRKTPEWISCYILSSAMFLYGLTVLAALGRGGMVTGPLNLALAAGSAAKAYVLRKEAQAVARTGG